MEEHSTGLLDELVEEMMDRPSIQVALLRQGFLDTRHPDFPWTDTLSVAKRNAIMGLHKGREGEPD
ncbi:hypothetical protein Hypma_006028 [Hypsizygus marmoreus]|uniref:Uncharacterized protein n=1 Tax=Hypsizygus marmoreus TaxID=39966 RepID=A0A369JYN5_HYPMA|nr:hypothetical protein Hypma_006028 [Hypsizygus marmoreus]